VSRKGPRRRLRVRRKRKGETFGSKVKDAALEGADEIILHVGAGSEAQVIGHLGGCVIEAIGSAAVLVALLTVPGYLLIR
jgi:hypothetical protein